MAYTLGWVAADWSINSSGDIRYIGDTHGGTSPSYVRVIDFHREMQDLADDQAASGNDLIDITKQTPSDRSTDNIITLLNGFNIDATAAEHLYDGSIIQASGAEIYDGVVNFGNAKYIIVHQNGAILNDTTDFWNAYAADATANYTFPPNNTQAGVSHNFLTLVRTGGADIDGRYLLGTTREFNNTYAEFVIQGTSRGNNVLALSESTDLNNQTAEGTVALYDKFANDNEGYDNTQDIDPLVVTEEYYSRWDIDNTGTLPATTATINDLYEYTKWLTRRGTASTLYGIQGDLFRGPTHEITYGTLAGGTFTEGTLIDINGVVDAAVVLADNGTDTMWIQLVKLSTTLSGTLDDGTATVTATIGGVTSRPVSPQFLGQSTGSAIIGAYGIGIAAEDLKASDALTDLGNQAIAPPNNVTFGVSGLTVGESYIVVGPRAGGVLDKTQLTLNGALSGAAVSSIVVNEAIPSDTPDSGTIRVVNDSGYEVYLPYTSWATSTFTLTGTYDFSGTLENDGCATSNGVFITYIDKLAGTTTETFTVVYNADRDLFIRVRDGGVTPTKTIEAQATLGNASSTVNVTAQPDV